MATSVIVSVNAPTNTEHSEENGSEGPSLTAGITNQSPPHRDEASNSSYHSYNAEDIDEWLKQNYEVAEGAVILRSAVRDHYLRHCERNKLYHVTAPILGKRIHVIFPGVVLRRLGKRGNSKYHYSGIRAIRASETYQFSGDQNSVVRQPSSQILYKLPPRPDGRISDIQKREYQCEQNTTKHSGSCDISNSASQHLYQQYLISSDRAGAVPEFPVIDFPPEIPIPQYCTVEDVDTFRSIYREHCEALLNAVVNLEFRTVESLWTKFWRCQDKRSDDAFEEKGLSKTKLYLLCSSWPIQQFVWRVDCLFYQNLLAVLFPDVLRPVSRSLAHAIRNFAEMLELWLTGAMKGCPEEITYIKISTVTALAQRLRRYSSLNRLAQAARSVLENSSQTDQLLEDLNRVDFCSVQEQASWAFQCDDSMVQQLEAHFRNTPHQQNSLEPWIVWLNGITAQVLKPHEGKPTFAAAARQFLLNWSFYSSVVFRHLTLQHLSRSTSLHLIRLLCDEYLFFLVEYHVALETGETFIAAMTQKYKSILYNLRDFINGDVHLTVAVPVPVGMKTAPTSLVVGTHEFNYHPVPTKRLKICEQLQ
ncbi:hypothetical protein B7P43_G10467 [Cryptotermes secundus]|uniref:RFX-type winged-helix domain-containing protein n=1 Tax=Cryptotermes secundus TaxID=105785 RepID=A0A2J7QKY4_9NEOP|nr:transcription factor RFX3-like [Cryptotermes secundus]PNF29239.1 hypothetical protein B7P43_G10467 [Cryptotermes secundus]